MFPYKQVSGRNGDHEWNRMTNAFILCDLLWKVQKCHTVNREGSFNNYGNIYLWSRPYVTLILMNGRCCKNAIFVWLWIYHCYYIFLCSIIIPQQLGLSSQPLRNINHLCDPLCVVNALLLYQIHSSCSFRILNRNLLF